MGQTKKIKINAEYLIHEKKKRGGKKLKPQVKNLLTANKVKAALINRIKIHQQKQKQGGKQPLPSTFTTNFKESLNYLDSIVNKKQTLKHEKKKKRRRRRKKETNGDAVEKGLCVGVPVPQTKITIADDPPYGILKGGKKPLYSQYKKTLRKNKNTTIVLPTNDTKPKVNELTLERQKKLEKLQKKVQTFTKKIRKKRYTLGKRKNRKVGILIKSKKTRKKIKKEHANLKKKALSEIRLYLKKHGLIKIGSSAPEKVLRNIYETSVLSGDIYNKNSTVLIHNYINDSEK